MSPRQTYEVSRDDLSAVVAWHAAYDHQEAMLQRFGIAYVFQHPELLAGKLPAHSYQRPQGDSLVGISDPDYLIPPARHSRIVGSYAVRTEPLEVSVPSGLEASIHTAARVLGHASATKRSPNGCVAPYGRGRVL